MIVVMKLLLKIPKNAEKQAIKIVIEERL